MYTFINYVFIVYTIILIAFSWIWLGQLALLPLVMVWTGVSNEHILKIVSSLAFLPFGFYIWVKVHKELKAAKEGATPKLTKNVIGMIILTVILYLILMKVLVLPA